MQFLELLLEDETQHRANKKLVSRIHKARFEEEKSLEGFDFTFNPNGVGKTHLAQALGHQACRQGYSVLFTRANRLLSDLGGV
ncbi:ATP-binding protein [Dehalococcoidia bacterium]|nr:ATP-binding protein [Dehalococcoidia bacterium]